MRRTYTNPVRAKNGSTPTDPDPFVLRFRGKFYCYSTGLDQVNVSVSEDLVVWKPLDAALAVEGRDNFWAPCVVYADGTFHMYVSFRPLGSDDAHEQRLHLAQSSTPEGPFQVVGGPMFDYFAIDADVVQSDGGRWWLYYSTNEPTGLGDKFVGTSILRDELVSPGEVRGEPEPVVTPTLPEEIFLEDRFGDGRDWYTIEGPAVFTDRDCAYMTYSGNAYERENYFIGYATSDNIDEASVWSKHPDPHTFAPLVRRTDQVEGTGHNSITVGPNLVDRWIVYHGRNADQKLTPGVEQRTMRVDPVWTASGRLFTSAPTRDPQPYPTKAALATEATTIDIEQGLVRELGNCWSKRHIAETWLTMTRTHLGARAGVVVAWSDERNFAEVLWDVASSTLTAHVTIQGLSVEVGRARVNLRHDAWQRIAWTRLDEDLRFTLGDITIAFSVGELGPTIGVSSHRTSTQFEDLRVAAHADLLGLELQRIDWELFGEHNCRVDHEGLAGLPDSPVSLARVIEPGEVIMLDFELLGAGGQLKLSAGSGEEIAIRERTLAAGMNASARNGKQVCLRFDARGEELELFVDGLRTSFPDADGTRDINLTLHGAKLRRARTSNTAFSMEGTK